MPADTGIVSRREALAAAAVGLSSTSGCVGRIWSAWERESPSQITVEIITPPEDEDIHALRIAQHLAQNLERAGVRVDVEPTTLETFFLRILINHNFDLFVWRHRPQYDPDALRALLHSHFAEERGWQNPYGFSNSVVDGLLEAQMRAEVESERREHLAELQELLGDERPFIPIAFEEEHRLVRSDRVERVSHEPFHEPMWLYRLEPAGEDTGPIFRLGTTDRRLTNNLNPIAIRYRGYTGLLELLYESPARLFQGDLIPWLAETWEWVSPTGARSPTLELRLREGLQWHDEESLTSEDVAFTYEFLQDTSMTDEDPHIPSPRYRGPMTLLDTVEAVNPRTLRLQFTETTRRVARHLLTVPILPAHVWEEWTDLTEMAGIPIDDITTDALIEENTEPVGSGPYEIVEVSENDLRVERIEDHVFVSGHDGEHPLPDIGPPHVDEFQIEIRPSASNIAESIIEGGLDGVLGGLGARLIAEHREEEHLTPVTQETSRLFHVGFNVREGPALSHAGFRAAIEPLIDRVYIDQEIFGGAARLTNTGVYDRSMVPEPLRWTSDDAERFAGNPGSGEVDNEEAREAFREAGFSFTEDGDLLVG